MTTPEQIQAAVERLGNASSHYDVSIPDVDTVLNALEAARQDRDYAASQLAGMRIELTAAQQELVELRELLTTIRKIGTGESQVAEDDTAGLQVIVDKIDASIQKAT